VKVGDLVRVKPQGQGGTPMVEGDWIGIITSMPDPQVCDFGGVIVYWSAGFPHEEEYVDQIEVISESR
jgi:hypothetical protein